MNKKISPTLIGAFVAGALALVMIAVVVFGSGRLFRKTIEFVLYFDSSVNGLRIGAPVKFRGVEIGSVTNILLLVEKDMKVQRIPVIIEIDRDKLMRRGASRIAEQGSTAFQLALDRGLRGQLQMESLVTGLLYIGLDVFPGSPANFVQPPGSKYQEIPTLPTTLEQAQDAVSRIIGKLEQIDLKGLVASVTAATQGVNQLVTSPALKSAIQSVDQTAPKVHEAIADLHRLTATIEGNLRELSGDIRETSAAARQTLKQAEEAIKITEGTMKQAEASIASVRTLVDLDSPAMYELTRSLREVSAAARSLRLLTGYLERNPRSLIFGKPETQEEK